MFRNFLEIFYSEAPGSGSVTPCHDQCGWGLLEVVNRSMVKVENDPGSLTLTYGLQEWMISKSCVSFGEECTMARHSLHFWSVLGFDFTLGGTPKSCRSPQQGEENPETAYPKQNKPVTLQHQHSVKL